MTVKCYLIEYSTENEIMFEDLREIGMTWRSNEINKNFFELYFLVPSNEVAILEDIMKWYV